MNNYKITTFLTRGFAFFLLFYSTIAMSQSTRVNPKNYKQTITMMGQEVNISSLVSGTYFISIDVKGLKTTQRFIKN
jgi:hypothetical protein